MKRNWWSIIAAFALFLSVTASAQNTRVKANVPFDFIVNGTTVPAGEYMIQPVDRQGKVLSIRNSDLQTVSTFMPNDKQSTVLCPQGKLVFHRYGDWYFLAEIWVQGELTGRQIPASAREKEMARSSDMNEVVVMAALQ